MNVEKSATPTRRAFLKSIAAAGTGAALAAVGTNQALSLDDTSTSVEDAKSASKGYQKTSHVKAYYASARF